MVHVLGSRAWRGGPMRLLAVVLAAAVAQLSVGCASMTFDRVVSPLPEPGLAAIAVRVFDTSGDAKVARISARTVSSTLECADDSYYEAFGSEWSLTDAAPGSCWLTVRYSPPGSPPGASSEIVSVEHVTLRAGETLSVDVVAHRSSVGSVFLAAAAVLFAVGVLAAMVASKGEWSSDRPTEALPSGLAARPVPGGSTRP